MMILDMIFLKRSTENPGQAKALPHFSRNQAEYSGCSSQPSRQRGNGEAPLFANPSQI